MRLLALSLAVCIISACKAQAPSSGVTLYSAHKILTQNPDQPYASAVAVNEGGIIVGVDDLSALKTEFRGATIDTQFNDKTILPGLIDPHIHMTLGAMMYGLDWVPPWDMPSPKGIIKGLPDHDALLARIAQLEKTAPAGPLIVYGYHNLVQGDLTRDHLDSISTARPIIVWHYSGHDFYLNSAAIEMAQITPALADKFHGIGLNDDGTLNGRVYEDAIDALAPSIFPILLTPQHISKGYKSYEALLRDAGVTTVAEMGYGIFGFELEDNYRRQFYKADSPYNLYLIPEHRALTRDHGSQTIAAIDTLIENQTDAKVLRQVKLFTDGAFYSQTMRMKAPGYIGGQSKGQNGLWVTQPEAIAGVMAPYWDAEIDIHIHSNGDAAQDATLAALSKMKPAADGQRLIIEHLGLMTPDQITIAKTLPMGISAASHYVNYMSEDYIEAIGQKVKYITPLASTMAAGIPTTVHSDAPLAPPQPMRAAKVHAMRLTRQGNVSTPSERLTREQALAAITINAAWSLGMEDEIGSIEIGKRADFTVMDANPLSIEPKDWDGIEIWGVVLNGELRPNSRE